LYPRLGFSRIFARTQLRQEIEKVFVEAAK